MSTAATTEEQPAGPFHRASAFPRWPGWLLDLLGVLGCAWWASRTSMGMDVNFDMVSYHFVYAWAFVHGADGLFASDAFANRYLNPLPEVPWYLTDRLLSPRWSTAVIAGVAGINLTVIRRIMRSLTVDRFGERAALVLGAAAMAVAGVGATFKAELGGSQDDVVVSVFALLGVWLLIDAARGRRTAGWRLALAGGMFGLATGLKLTMLPYAVGCAVVGIILAVAWRSLRPVMQIALGGVLGVLLGGGWWFAQVWAQTGNPVFPYFNTIFDASGYPDADLRDPRFGARSLSDALHFPIYMWDGTTRLLDVPVRDPRWVITGLVLAVTLVALVARWILARRLVTPLPVVVAVTMFVVPGVVWIKQFGIARYAVTTELLCGVAIVGGLAALAGVLRLSVPRLLPIVAVIGVVALAGAALMNSDTRGRYQHIPFASTRFQIDAAPLRNLPTGSMVVVDNYYGASGFLLPSLKDSTQRHIVHSWFWGSRMLTDDLGKKFRAAKHLYVLIPPKWAVESAAGRTEPKYLGLEPDLSSCVTVHSFSPRSLCPAKYVGAAYHGLPPILLTKNAPQR